MAATRLRPTARRRARFHTLTISQVRPLTDDAIEVTFDVPAELADEYRYDAGQYVAIRTTLEGSELRRSYSICQAPTPGALKVAIKRDLGGLFSTWAIHHLRGRDVARRDEPRGHLHRPAGARPPGPLRRRSRPDRASPRCSR